MQVQKPTLTVPHGSHEIPTAALEFPVDPLHHFSFAYQSSVLHSLLIQLISHTISLPRALSQAQIRAERWP